MLIFELQKWKNFQVTLTLANSFFFNFKLFDIEKFSKFQSIYKTFSFYISNLSFFKTQIFGLKNVKFHKNDVKKIQMLIMNKILMTDINNFTLR